MRIGLTGRLLALWAVAGLPCARLAAQTTAESAYSPPQFYAISDGQTGPVQALFTTPVGNMMSGAEQSPFIDAHGNPVILPASYAMGCSNGCATDPAGGCYGGGDCGCSYPGVEQVPPNYYGADQCGPHYFDCRAEAVYMKRDKTFGRNVVFSALVPAQGPVELALESDQLDYNYEPGFRILGRYDLGPLSVVEFGYFGIFDWAENAVAIDATPGAEGEGDLFSLYSRPAASSATDFAQYGTTPITVRTLTSAGGPMQQTERSVRHSINIDTELQTAEMSYRRYWVGYSPRVSGTLLAGFRYTKMKENFLFHTLNTEGAGAYLDNSVLTDNDLAGFQTGGDVWLHLWQGLRVGGEAKAGIYNNHFDMADTIVASPVIPGAENYRFRGDRVAFIGEASADVVADILPSWSLRAGAELLLLNTVVLAGENFNTGSPFGLAGQAPRVAILNDQGSVMYYGFHAGLEYVW
jgi:hypothetical protein